MLRQARTRLGPPAGRRPTAKIAVAALLAVVLGLGATAPGAEALRTWCRSDPVVTIEGTLVDVLVSAPFNAPLLVNGPNRVVVTVRGRADSAQVVVTEPPEPEQ